MKANENTRNQNLWDSSKTVLREKFIPINAYIKKKSKINKLTLQLKKLEKEQLKPKTEWR